MFTYSWAGGGSSGAGAGGTTADAAAAAAAAALEPPLQTKQFILLMSFQKYPALATHIIYNCFNPGWLRLSVQ